MHTELLKHDMRKDGEDNIYDTAGMAICLGVVKNYTCSKNSDTERWEIKHDPKLTEEDEIHAMSGNLEGMFVLKEV
jgi:hypothetical protein